MPPVNLLEAWLRMVELECYPDHLRARAESRLLQHFKTLESAKTFIIERKAKRYSANPSGG